MSSLLSLFWSQEIWCPNNVTWADFTPDNAQLVDLNYAVLTAFGLLLLRCVLTRLVFEHVAILCGLKAANNNQTPTQDNAYLERMLHEKKTRNGDTHGMTEFQIKRYLRLNTFNKRKQNVIDKFTESTWRCLFYMSASTYGWLYVLPGKAYTLDTLNCFRDYPHHPVTADEWWYYNIELGFYISLLMSQFFDTKRKDFWQMFVHHIATVVLIVFSWACNFHRIGCLVLAIHDVADVPLEGAKLARYAKRQRLADVIFFIFTGTWIYSRCWLLPRHIIYYTAYDALNLIPIFPAYYIFNALLVFLQMLHFIWTWIIIKMAFYAIKNNGMKDLRSETEDSHSE